MRRIVYSIWFFPILFLLLSLFVSFITLWLSKKEFLRLSQYELFRNTKESAYVLTTMIEEASLKKDPNRLSQIIQRYSLQSAIKELHILDSNGVVLYSSNPKHLGQRDPYWKHIHSDLLNAKEFHTEKMEAKFHVILPLEFIYNPFSKKIEQGVLAIDLFTQPTWIVNKQYSLERFVLFTLLLLAISLLVLFLIYRLYIKQLFSIKALLFPKEKAYSFNILDLITKLMAKINELKLFSAIMHKSHDAIIIADKDLKILSTNESFKKMTQFSDAKSRGKTINELLSPIPPFDKKETLLSDGETSRQCSFTRADGSRFNAIEERFLIKDEEGNILNIATIIKDITTFLRQKEHIEKLAFYDPLTNLANRSFFLRTLEEFIVIAKREHKTFALLYIDLDDFKEINDTLGHSAGDRVLVEFAKRLQKSLRKSDLAARFGGDEFGAITFIKEPNEALEIGWRIIKEATKPIKIDDQSSVTIGTSVGIALFPQNASSSQELLAAADIALYKAKEQKNRCRLYEEELHQKAIQKMQLKRDLKLAIAKEEFFLLYQPKIDTKHRSIIGFEVLIRWQKGDEVVPPFLFIPIAEESGLIVPITEWIFKQINKDLAILKEHGLQTSFAINISAKHFMAKNLPQMIRQVDSQFLQQGAIELEVTESAVMEELEVAQKQLHRLKSMGIKIALDDYGTGHSSLAYLKHLPIDMIKIDKVFIDNITSSTQDQAIIKSVIALSQSFGIEVLAEGVEDAQQLAKLNELGLYAMQGYYFAKPLPFVEMVEFLKTFK